MWPISSIRCEKVTFKEENIFCVTSTISIAAEKTNNVFDEKILLASLHFEFHIRNVLNFKNSLQEVEADIQSFFMIGKNW